MKRLGTAARTEKRHLAAVLVATENDYRARSMKIKKNVKAHYYAILTYMDGKTMHPDPGGAPLTESRRTTKRARPRLG